MFNALKYTEILEQAGLTKKQAEQIVKVLIEIMEQNLASKHDLKEFKLEIIQEIKQLKVEADHQSKEMELRMTIKLGSMILATGGLMLTLMKLF